MNPSSTSVLTLNIGGTLYTTTSTTLLNPAVGDTFFTSLLSGRFESTRDKDGNFFIDRNGKYFEFVLEFLRTSKWRVPSKVKMLVREEAAFYGIPLPFAVISDDLCDELLLRSQAQQDPSGEVSNLRHTILSLWEKRVAEGNRKIACIVLDTGVQGQDYKYFSQGGWAMMNDFKSEEARVGIPYLERPHSFALLQHEWGRERFRNECKQENDLTVTVSEVRAYNKTDQSLNPIFKIVGFKLAWIRSAV